MKTLLLGGLVGGIILFAWSALSWMLLPVHTASLKKFGDEAAVIQAISAQAKESGVYYAPYPDMTNEAAIERAKAVPHVFAAVRLEAPEAMNQGMMYLKQILIMILAAIVMTWLLTKTSGLSYLGKASYAMGIGIAAAVLVDLPNWVWWGFSGSFTLGYVIDHVVGTFLAGLGIAKFVKN